jgi:hypothetical protein
MGDCERLPLALKAPQQYSYDALEDPKKQIRLLFFMRQQKNMQEALWRKL